MVQSMFDGLRMSDSEIEKFATELKRIYKPRMETNDEQYTKDIVSAALLGAKYMQDLLDKRQRRKRKKSNEDLKQKYYNITFCVSPLD